MATATRSLSAWNSASIKSTLRVAGRVQILHPMISVRLLALAGLAAGFLRAAPLLEFSDVFPANHNGIARHRIPSVVVPGPSP